MIDIIIATSNRLPSAIFLAETLLKLDSNFISKIFLIDGTSQQIKQDLENKKIEHILTSHRNQPYQRYLGYSISKADVLLFLDDDMEIANENCITIIQKVFKDKKADAIAINFVDKHDDTSLAAIPTSKLFNKTSLIKRGINWFTGYSILPPGKLGLCGVRGPQPQFGGQTEFVSGGAFAARRTVLYKNFNMQLFDLYQNKFGKGEDAIMGYTINKLGSLQYLPDLLFFHNDQQNSIYTIDHFLFSTRVVFSRLYLSLEKTRLDGGSMFYAKVHYHWHTIWRVLGLCINYVIEPSVMRKNLMGGAINGWKNSFKFNFDKANNRNKHWQTITN